MVTNGDFETGDLTDWTDDTTGSGTYEATATVTEGAKHAGTYGCRLYASITAAGSLARPAISQTISSDFTSLDFWYKCNSISGTSFYQNLEVFMTIADEMEINPVYVNFRTDPNTEWTHVSLTKAQLEEENFYEGYAWDTTTTITIRARVYSGTTSALELFIDDVMPEGDPPAVATTTDLQGVTDILQEQTLDPTVVSAHIIADVADHLVSGTFEFEGSSFGGIYSSNFWTKFEFYIPDYQGTQQPVFVGMFPSSQTRYSETTENQTLTGYDFGWFLTHNPLSDSELVLLSSAKQADVTRYQLEFTDQEHWFQVGNIVTGGNSGHTGRVVDVYYSEAYDAIILENPTGVFENDDPLNVGGTLYAYADGTAVDVTGDITYDPEDWIAKACGGDDSEALYGLELYRIASTGGVWGVTKPEVDFVFPAGTSIYDAIDGADGPTRYLEYIFYPFWRTNSGAQTPCIYWIPGSSIDDGSNGLDLPSAVTITSPDPYLVSVARDQVGDESYNRIVVRCRLLNGTWYTKTVQSSGLDDDPPTEYLRTKVETARNIATTTDCDARATALYNYYISQSMTYKAAFLQRSDFKRLQKLTFSGYNTTIPDGDYRILRIEYEYGEEGTINRQTVTLISDSAYQVHMSLLKSYTDTIKEMQAIAKAEIEKYDLPEIGTVVSVDGTGGAMYTSEQDILKPAVDPNP